MSARSIASVVAEELLSERVVRVIRYRRISSDPRETRAGVDRQGNEIDATCEHMSAATGERWVVVGTITDNDESNSIARSNKKPRAGFKRLLDAMENGTSVECDDGTLVDFDAIAFFHQDRFVKTPGEWGRWMDLQLAQRGKRVAVAQQGEVDVSSESGFMLSCLSMLSSTTDTMRQIKRTRSFAAEQRSRGKINRCAYGWRRVVLTDDRGYKVAWHDEIDPTTSSIVSECARRVLAGESGWRVARDLNARGVATPSGRGEWSHTSVRLVLLRSINIGVRLDDDGKIETPLALPPILTRAQWLRLRALYGDTTRKTTTDPRVRHLLSGIARCGKCGGSMRRMTMQKRVRETHSTYRWEGYSCDRSQHVAMIQSVVDERVTDALLSWLDGVDVSTLVDDGGAAQRAAEELEELQAELDAYVADSKRKIGDPLRLSKRQLDEHRLALVPQIEDARRRAARTMTPAVDLALQLSRQSGSAMRHAWDRLAIEQRRTLVESWLDVTINPSPYRGRQKIDASRVAVTLKER